MLRHLKKLAILLLVGAAINAAIVMSLIWFGSVTGAERHRLSFNGAIYQRQDTTGMTFVRWEAVHRNNLFEKVPPPYWSRLHTIPLPYLPFDEWRVRPDKVTQFEFAAGWPMRAVTYEFDIPYVDSQAVRRIRSGIELPGRKVSTSEGPRWMHRAIPTRIIPAGFAVNTVLYASVVALLWHVPIVVRRACRRRANQCLNCGYSRTGLPSGAPCPECNVDPVQYPRNDPP